MSFILDTASAHPVAATAVTAVVGATALYNLGAFSDNRKFPPGPKPHPFVGHTFQTPATKIWMWFEELGKQYGPIIRLSLAGDELVVLNDPEDAEELVSFLRLAAYIRFISTCPLQLGRRSHNYSSRKPLVYAGRHQSRNKRLVLLPYGPALKTQRAAFHTMLQPRGMLRALSCDYYRFVLMRGSQLLVATRRCRSGSQPGSCTTCSPARRSTG